MLAEPSCFVLIHRYKWKHDCAGLAEHYPRTKSSQYELLTIVNSPFFILVLSFVVLWLSARLGAEFRKQQLLEDDLRHDLDVVVGATLTLLGLIIGFTFSMAVNRYDQRKNYEETEANAIGTEYVRADLLPDADAAKVRALLRDYLDQRILFYQLHDEERLGQVNRATAQLQTDLWSAVLAPAAARPTPVLTRSFGHERRVELAGVHAGCLVESNSRRGMDTNDGDCCFRQCDVWLRCAPP